jgi:hypothetical protein
MEIEWEAPVQAELHHQVLKDHRQDLLDTKGIIVQELYLQIRMTQLQISRESTSSKMLKLQIY